MPIITISCQLSVVSCQLNNIDVNEWEIENKEPVQGNIILVIVHLLV